MLKPLDRPESFTKKFSKLFSSKYLKKDAMLLATGFATVSQTANHCQTMLHHNALLQLN